jgi:hypothetical protein
MSGKNFSSEVKISREFIGRVHEYALKTGIRLKRVPRLSSWQRYGLPDLRGFAPQLRAINVCDDQKVEFGGAATDPGSLKDLWVIHDVLHIIFYDFATLNLGFNSWLDRDRFIESHLASEAFAVLALDYHFLIHSKVKGLAVDLDSKDWRGFQELYPYLPELQTFEFSKMLVEFYLSGEGLLADLYSKSAAVHGKAEKRLSHWLGHEIRYADKQRSYVVAWHEDLQQAKASKKKAHVENSFVAGPLWELIGIFCGDNVQAFKSLVSECRSQFSGPQNFFSQMPKYQIENPALDFRFTDVLSLTHEQVRHHIEKARAPSSSGLFLFWQIVSMNTPAMIDETARRAVQKLALSSQTSKVDARAWKTVRQLAIKTLDRVEWNVDAEGRGTFFLP